MNPVYAVESHFPNTDFTTTLIQIMELLNVQFSPPPDTSSLLGPNILLSTLFSNTLNQCSSHNMTNQVSHPYKAKGKIMVLYISIFTFLHRHKTKILNCMW
jgi:hypothetical protein